MVCPWPPGLISLRRHGQERRLSDFVRIASVEELEDVEVRSFEVDGQLIAVAVVDGRYYAFDDTCTHARCSLADGDLSGTTIICACHDGEYDVTTGEVLDGPPPEPLETYRVRVVDGEVQVEV